MGSESQSIAGMPPTTGDLSESKERGGKSKGKSMLLWLQFAVFLLGSGLLFFVIYKIGFQTLLETISRIGWGFLFIVFLNGTRHLLRSICIYLAVVPQKFSQFKFRHALAARLGGEAVSVITFTGPFLGEAAKAALLKKNVPLSHSGAAIVVDNILYYTSVIFMILTGVGIMSYAYTNGKTLQYVLQTAAFFSVLSFIGLMLLVWFRVKPVGFTIRRLARKNFAPKFLLKRLPGINELETNVYDFYNHRRTTFFSLLGINFLAHALSVAEVYAVLYMLGFSPAVSVSFIIESLTKIINFSFSFVPGGVGVYEGGSGIILHALGYATATGVALALVRRGAILFWTSIGLAILLWRTVTDGTRRLAKSGE